MTDFDIVIRQRDLCRWINPNPSLYQFFFGLRKQVFLAAEDV